MPIFISSSVAKRSALVEEGDENGAENGTGDASQPADDDHGDVLDGEAEIEGFRRDASHVEGPQCAGEAGVEGADAEGEELVGKIGIPIPSAARSLSRMAMKARP